MADNLTLYPRHIVGIIQRVLLETNAYLGQPADHVDPEYVMDRLKEAAHFTAQLPAQRQADTRADTKAEARAN